MAIIDAGANITPREQSQINFEREMFDKQADLQIRLKELDVEALKVEARFNSWLKLPVILLKLPLLILLGFGFIVLCVTKQKPDEKFWQFVNK